MAAMTAEQRQRIERELSLLAEGGQQGEIITGEKDCVLYKAVPTGGIPAVTDVVVPITSGYPAGGIDLAGLPEGSPLIPRVAGGTNLQGSFAAGDLRWTLASYHPHQGNLPPFDQMTHGFHTYYDHILSWLTVLT